MGKKGKGKKAKGASGADKEARLLHSLAKKGVVEKDVEEILRELEAAQIAKEEALMAITVTRVDKPKLRQNVSVVAHPSKEELIIFGGEEVNGDRILCSNDLYYLKLNKLEYTRVSSRNSPAPRTSHQAVAIDRMGGQMWLFGGEFTSPSGLQFKHFRDLWMLSLKDNAWTKIDAKGGPSARSGHRMTVHKHCLYVYGGFQDSDGINSQFFSDIHVFDLDNHVWLPKMKLQTAPSPRSACHLFTGESTVCLYGGYHKETVKGAASEQTAVYDDMWQLDVNGALWSKMKRGGTPPRARSGAASAQWRDRLYVFGGVCDSDPGEESDLQSEYFNDMHVYNLSTHKWYPVRLRGEEADGDHVDEEGTGEASGERKAWPVARFNAKLAVIGNTAYLHGGLVDAGAREVTLGDLWQLDLSKLDEWRCLVALDEETLKNLGRVIDSDEDDEWENVEGTGEESDESDDSDESEEDEVGPATRAAQALPLPEPQAGETSEGFFSRTRSDWLDIVNAQAVDAGEALSGKHANKAAKEHATRVYDAWAATQSTPVKHKGKGKGPK